MTAEKMVVQLSVSELRTMISEAVGEALDARAPKASVLLDQKALAEALGVSERYVYSLRQEGLPTIMIGESPRFEIAAVLAYMKKSTWQRTVDEMTRLAHAALNEPEPVK